MKKLVTLLLAMVLMTSAALAVSIKLAWCPNPEASVSGYKLYYVATNKVPNWKPDVYANGTNCPPTVLTNGGPWVRNYTTNLLVSGANNTTGTVSNLIVGKTYYFSVTAVDTNGLESDFSSEVEFTVTNFPPSRPQFFQILNVAP